MCILCSLRSRLLASSCSDSLPSLAFSLPLPAALHLSFVVVMDGVTQLQNYLSSITSFMTFSLQHAWQGAGAVSVEQMQQAVREEHQAHALKSSAEGSAAGSTAAAASTAASSADAAASPVLPSLDAPQYSGLHPSVEHAMADRAHQLFKRVLEADALMQALPPLHLPPHDLTSQAAQIAFLEECNQQAGKELEAAQAEAALWQKRVRFVLQQAAACQLRTSTNQEATNTASNGEVKQ